MSISFSTSRWLPLVAASMAALALAGCTPGSSSPSSRASDTSKVTQPVTTEAIAALGDVTLTAAAETTQQPFLDKLVVDYEKTYPNVKVNISYKSFDDHMATVVNMSAGPNAPDLIEGNNGHAVDGALVSASLIRPLDDVASAYKWLDGSGATNLDVAKWSGNGSSFGSGTLYGVSPIGEVLSLYYNADKLSALGLPVPKSVKELAAVLPKIAAAKETPLVLGNSDQWSATHVFSAIAAQYEKAADTRAWIGGKPGITFVADGNVKAATELADWARSGYFNTDYNGINNGEARARFAAGQGVFFIGGSWNGTDLQETSKIHAAPLVEGGVGGLSQPWHISASTKNLLPAVTFLAMMQSEKADQYAVDAGLLPLTTQGITAKTILAKEMLTNTEATAAAGTAIGYYDYATTDMGTEMGAAVQDLMAGRMTPEQFVQTIQETWVKGGGK